MLLLNLRKCVFDPPGLLLKNTGLSVCFLIPRVAGHPLAQNERCLHMFLQDEIIDKSYTPSKIRHA